MQRHGKLELQALGSKARKPGTTPHVESVMCRAPRFGPLPAFISFNARIVSS